MAVEIVDILESEREPQTPIHKTKTHGQKLRRKLPTDAVMNEEWSALHAQPLLWSDASRSTLLDQLQSRMSEVESRFKATFGDHIDRLRSLLRNRPAF